MRSSARTSLPIRHALVLFATAGIAWPACAELDYEFAKALLEREQYSFKTCDMVERLVAQLEQSSATLTDSKLIKATLRRRQAAAASAERAVKLLEEASALYAEILAGSRTFRLYSVAEQESAPLARELLHARLRIIADRPDLAPRLRAEAAAAMEATAKTHAAAAAMAYPAFKPWYEKFIKHKERFPDKPVPREIFDPLRKTFDAWIVADQRYVSASVEQLDCYDDADPAKKALATRLAKHCEDKANDQGLFDFPVLEAWYWFMQGRTYALVQDEAQAGKAWDNVRDMEMTGLDADQKKALFGMKKAILRDLVKLKLKARKYSDVETIVSDAWVNPDYETLWREDAGKSLILDFATALVSPPEASAADLERAIGRLQEMINREPHMADKTPWTCEFARAMADAVRDNGKRGNPPLRLSAPAWYHVAFGFRLKGDEQYRRFLEAGKDKPDAAPHFERACDEYQNAADCYRFAILECRREKTDLLTRLTVEPRAWYELALCYLPSRHYYEAIIACQAMRSTYLPQKREKWLPSQMKAVPQREQPKVAAALAEIEPLLNSAASWMLVAIEENRKAHRNPWDDVLDVDDGQGDPLRNDSRFGDPQYRAAKKDLIAARTLVETARESPATAAQDYEKAETTFVRAAEKFLAVQPSSKAWEPALYQAGAAFAQAEELWASGKIAARSAESRTEKSKALAARALDALGRYEEVVRAAAATSNEGEAREQRLQLQGPVLLARVTLHRATGEWEKAVKSAEAYLEWEQSASPPRSNAHAALLGKFLALVEQAAASPAPACGPYLEDAETTLQQAHAKKPDDATTQQFMLESLSRRYIIAAAQAEKSKLGEGAIAGYHRKAARLQEQRLNALRDAATLEDHSRVFYLFHKAGEAQKAVEVGKRLLDTFDARHLPDEPKVWQGLLATMLAAIRYADLATWDRCRQDHRLLVDYMYDLRDGVPENDPGRTPDDRYNANMEKAARQLDSIKRNYPDCQTLNAKFGEGGKAFLTVIEEEIDCRRKIAAVRQLVPSLAVGVAEGMAEAKNEGGARKYREIANEEIKKALDRDGDRVDLKLLSARLDMLNGNYAAATTTLQEIQVSTDSESAEYFDASKLLSEVCARQKQWREAADYPEFLWLTVGRRGMVRERWPDIETFLKRCYANGVPRPAAVQFRD